MLKWTPVCLPVAGWVWFCDGPDLFAFPFSAVAGSVCGL